MCWPLEIVLGLYPPLSEMVDQRTWAFWLNVIFSDFLKANQQVQDMYTRMRIWLCILLAALIKLDNEDKMCGSNYSSYTSRPVLSSQLIP